MIVIETMAVVAMDMDGGEGYGGGGADRDDGDGDGGAITRCMGEEEDYTLAAANADDTMDLGSTQVSSRQGRALGVLIQAGSLSLPRFRQ